MTNEIRILGGKKQTGVQILSASSPPPQTPVELEVTVHEELITEDDKARKDRKPGDPEIRIRSATTKDFEAVKRGEDK